MHCFLPEAHQPGFHLGGVVHTHALHFTNTCGFLHNEHGKNKKSINLFWVFLGGGRFPPNPPVDETLPTVEQLSMHSESIKATYTCTGFTFVFK